MKKDNSFDDRLKMLFQAQSSGIDESKSDHVRRMILAAESVDSPSSSRSLPLMRLASAIALVLIIGVFAWMQLPEEEPQNISGSIVAIVDNQENLDQLMMLMVEFTDTTDDGILDLDSDRASWMGISDADSYFGLDIFSSNGV